MTRTSRSASPRRSSSRAGVLTTLALLVLASCNASAGEPHKPAAPAAPAPSLEVTGPAAAMRVTLDPATGQIVVPTPGATLEPMWSGLRLPSGPLPVVHLADGSLMIDLKGIYLTNVVGAIGWDGHPTMSCVDFGVDPVEYARWLTLIAPPARAKVKE